MYYKGEFDLGCYFYDNVSTIITSVFSLESNTSGCVCTTRRNLTWAAISTIITSVFSLKSNTSGCVCTTRGSLWFYTWAAISMITFLG